MIKVVYILRHKIVNPEYIREDDFANPADILSRNRHCRKVPSLAISM